MPSTRRLWIKLALVAAVGAVALALTLPRRLSATLRPTLKEPRPWSA